MERYLNLNGFSAIVIFDDNSAFEYTYANAGQFNIEHAKILAQRGALPNAHINQKMKFLYSGKTH